MRLPTAALLAGALAYLAAPAGADEPAKAEEGKPAPDITLQATNIGKVLPGKKEGDTLSLKELRGKNVVLFFYPKAMTGG